MGFWPPLGVVAEVEAEAVGEGDAEALLRPLFGVSMSCHGVLCTDSKLFQGATKGDRMRMLPLVEELKGVSPYVKVNKGSWQVQLAPVLACKCVNVSCP